VEGGAVGASIMGAGMLRGYRFKDSKRPHAPLTGVSVKEVQLEKSALGRGQRTDGLAIFTPVPGPHYYLEAISPENGHSWKLWVGDRRDGRAAFWLGCSRRRPRSVVHWSFCLWHANGRRSNAFEVDVQCTGDEAATVPTDPPRGDTHAGRGTGVTDTQETSGAPASATGRTSRRRWPSTTRWSQTKLDPTSASRSQKQLRGWPVAWSR
jgi:hypothetical protein